MKGFNTPLLITLLLAALAITTSHALAQPAPDGNAHPESNLVMDTNDAGWAFGAPTESATSTAKEKHAFAEALDLEPLADLAVFHNGRVKILDSLARETVDRMCGRRNYFEFLPPENEGDDPTKIAFPPLFTLLDCAIDPFHYADKPLIHVEYLPLRRLLLEAEFPDDERMRERYMRLTRLTPAIIERHAPAVIEAHGFEEPYNKALRKVDAALGLWQMSQRNMLLVAPDTRDDPWAHIATLPDDHPARAAALDLGRAWRANDADAANEAINTLAIALPAISPDVYPDARRHWEAVYNDTNAFEWGYWLYFVSLISLILAFGTGRRWLVFLGVATLVAALGMHAFGFGLRCYLAERYAIQNQFESMTGLSLAASLLGAVVMGIRRQWLFGAAAAGVGFLVLILATQSGIPGVHIQREAAILNTSVLLKYHVTTVLVSYGLISLGFIISLFYLGTHYAALLTGKLGKKAAIAGADGAEGLDTTVMESAAAGALGYDESAPVGVRKTLVDLDKATMVVLQLAFWTLGVGILLGAWWADHSWGRWWAFDPKETWALATWIIYLIVIHVRQVTGKNKGLVTAWLSVLGFFVMLWTYFGVNLLLPGLHAYA